MAIEVDREAYYRRHARCPECGKKPYLTTVIFDIHLPDTNIVYCRCNWVGGVDDLKPDPSYREPGPEYHDADSPG